MKTCLVGVFFSFLGNHSILSYPSVAYFRSLQQSVRTTDKKDPRLDAIASEQNSFLGSRVGRGTGVGQ